MKLVSWQEWLDKHIPYYEAERHRNRFLDNPPESVLIIYPDDKIRSSHTLKRSDDYEIFSQTLESCSKYPTSPLFLERDTLQQWFWAFWNKNEALLCMLKLS
jgi:hypothetical protein